MPATPAELFAFLDRLGIPHRTVTHAPMFTVEQSRALRDHSPGGYTKNLFLKDKKGALFLVVALEDAAIEAWHRPLRSRTRRQSAVAQATPPQLECLVELFFPCLALLPIRADALRLRQGPQRPFAAAAKM
jgi:hypothetical protein